MQTVNTIAPLFPPQIKICGLTSVREAQACVAAGADAIGFISYPKSPRHLEDQVIRRITAHLPSTVCPVGVFVNENFERIMQAVDIGGLKAVQLHGREDPALVEALTAAGLMVVKALFVNGNPPLEAAARYPATAFLVECAGGPLPGGNAMDWNWADARQLPADRPVILAGGLTPDNIAIAIAAGGPAAVDVSSGVEISPGRKDMAKVTAFCRAVATCGATTRLKIFG
ncbi:MAG: phosphoribosylanthranilate isomerase [Desulfobacteraceae bacterium]|nr:phosphoribosylanthranilate isomerase [Desulfobacteraceae bacterium]MBC2749515.1 phosphoribosylanthranilate isomerase [Desulfobacteraceae bacterium]